MKLLGRMMVSRRFLLPLLLVVGVECSFLHPRRQPSPLSSLRFPDSRFHEHPHLQDLRHHPLGTDDALLASPVTRVDKDVIEIDTNVLDNMSDNPDFNSVMELLGIQDPEDFKAGSRGELTFGIASRNGGGENVLENPQQAHCEPELKPVDLGFDKTQNTYYPSCVRVKQCGGCCHNKELFSCQPVAFKTLSVRVLKLTPNGGPKALGSLRREGSRPRRGRRRRATVNYEILKSSVDEHLGCECMCKLRESECDLSIHSYDDQSCECVCKNRDEYYKCMETKTKSHYWVKSSCQCLCRNVQECSTGEIFDHNTCGCIQSRNNIPYNGFSRSARPVFTNSTRHRKPVLLPLK